MRNWGRLVDEHLEINMARGPGGETVKQRRRELDRLGCWPQNRRPRSKLEEVGAEQLIGYLKIRTAHRSKSRLCGSMSIVRGLGEFLVRREVWANHRRPTFAKTAVGRCWNSKCQWHHDQGNPEAM